MNDYTKLCSKFEDKEVKRASDDPKCRIRYDLTEDAKRRILNRVIKLKLFKEKEALHPFCIRLHPETFEEVKIDLVETNTLNKVDSISGILIYTEEYITANIFYETSMQKIKGDIYIGNTRLADFVGENQDDKYSLLINKEVE